MFLSHRFALRVACATLLAAAPLFAGKSELVLIGSGHQGIYPYRLDLATGDLDPMGPPAQIAAPSFFAIAPNRKFVYSISEGEKKQDSFISAFALDSASGRLSFINRHVTGGTGPCFISVDPKGENALVANYNSGSVSVFPIQPGGSLGEMSAFVQDEGSGPNKSRQEGPHAHCIVTDAADHYAFACDLGLDKVMVFKFDPKRGSLVANDPAFAPVQAGQGPRHIAFHPNGRFAYVASEMGSTITSFSYDARHGVLNEIEQVPMLPDNFDGVNYAAEIAVHPNGKWLFASNRGENTIVTYHCDPKTGRLELIGRTSTGGQFPRHFDLDATGKFLLVGNQESGDVHVFRIDKKTGQLAPAGHPLKFDMPMCIQTLEY